MADSHLFTLFIPLRDDLSPLELHTLDYLFNDRKDPPAQWPDHDYFRLRAKPERMGVNNGLPEGAYVSAAWYSSDYPGVYSGVHLTMPNIKADWFYETYLYLAQWLATLSNARGYVGALKNQDDNEGLPWVFYVYDGRLYMNVADRNTVLNSTVSDDTYQWT